MPNLPDADLVLTNGRVFRGLREGMAEAVALWAGRVLATGTSAEMAALVGPATRVVDLRGRLATAGLHDAHLHLLPYGLGMRDLDTTPAALPTLDALLAAVRARARAAAPGAWILGRGHDQFELDAKRHPTREELDAAAPDNPVYLVRACGHVAIANSRALALAGIDEATPVPQGGAIEQRDGRLTGLLAETGRDRLKAVLPDPGDQDLVEAIERAGRACLAYGITSVMDAAVGMRAGYREVVAYRTAQRTGRLPVRVNQCLLGGPGGIVERAHAEGVVTGAGDDMLRVGPVKIFTDGSAGGRTAAMSQPYLGEPETRGLMLLKDAEMAAYVSDYHRMGYQLAVHAIGDAAIEQTLDAFEAALAADPDPDRRHRVEHCGFNRPDQIDRMVRLGVEPVPQPVFHYDFGDLYRTVVGDARAFAAYPMRTWIARGLRPAASSDAPVCDINPFPNLYTMVTRRTSRGAVMDEGQVLTMAEALAAFTEFGAYVNRCEHHRGRLAPGLAADVAVFSRDLLAAAPEAVLHDTRCDLTIRGGVVVHDAAGEAS
ncbi:N-substituted formamide deformylase [Methylobacterium crusticola]|uniref:N-substituted formamide deformylase n=1 Tax=Methylobacterium crusticola TaxID=1697972 RepID=A0ABQ4R728_9HYPH|nr:amidohydrolase [Methylobacterium crusticola]GJD53039.1 N-substituted formamide deformylase [Methylobacterium crusticola]